MAFASPKFKNNPSKPLSSDVTKADERGMVSRGTSARTRVAAPGALDHSVGVQVQDLQDRYINLEKEAKAHTSVLLETINQTKQRLAVVKEDNRKLTAELGSHGGKAAESSAEQLEKEVHDLRRNYDKLIQEKRTLLTKLQNVQDELQALQRDAGPGATGRTSREIRQLENRIDKAMLKANEAQSIKCTYEQVLKRLRQERLMFDPHVRALEELVQTKTYEVKTAQQRQRDVQREKEQAKAELLALEDEVAKERAERSAKLAHLREASRSIGAANQAMLVQQFATRSSLAAALTSRAHIPPAKAPITPNTVSDHPHLRDNDHDGDTYQVNEGDSMEGGRQEDAGVVKRPERADRQGSSVAVETPQEALAALCNALSAQNLEALLQQLTSHIETFKSLKDMQHASTHQVSQMLTQVADARRAVEDAASQGRQQSLQAALDAAQQQLNQAQDRLEAARTAHDKVMKVYIDVRSGIEHLAAMVSPLPLPPGHIPVPLSDETLGDVLAQCQYRLIACVTFIRTIPKASQLLESMMQNPELSFA